MERASLFDGITEFPCGDSVFCYLEVEADKSVTVNFSFSFNNITITPTVLFVQKTLLKIMKYVIILLLLHF